MLASKKKTKRSAVTAKKDFKEPHSRDFILRFEDNAPGALVQKKPQNTSIPSQFRQAPQAKSNYAGKPLKVTASEALTRSPVVQRNVGIELEMKVPVYSEKQRKTCSKAFKEYLELQDYLGQLGDKANSPLFLDLLALSEQIEKKAADSHEYGKTTPTNVDGLKIVPDQGSAGMEGYAHIFPPMRIGGKQRLEFVFDHTDSIEKFGKMADGAQDILTSAKAALGQGNPYHIDGTDLFLGPAAPASWANENLWKSKIWPRTVPYGTYKEAVVKYNLPETGFAHANVGLDPRRLYEFYGDLVKDLTETVSQKGGGATRHSKDPLKRTKLKPIFLRNMHGDKKGFKRRWGTPLKKFDSDKNKTSWLYDLRHAIDAAREVDRMMASKEGTKDYGKLESWERDGLRSLMAQWAWYIARGSHPKGKTYKKDILPILMKASPENLAKRTLTKKEYRVFKTYKVEMLKRLVDFIRPGETAEGTNWKEEPVFKQTKGGSHQDDTTLEELTNDDTIILTGSSDVRSAGIRELDTQEEGLMKKRGYMKTTDNKKQKKEAILEFRGIARVSPTDLKGVFETYLKSSEQYNKKSWAFKPETKKGFLPKATNFFSKPLSLISKKLNKKKMDKWLQSLMLESKKNKSKQGK